MIKEDRYVSLLLGTIGVVAFLWYLPTLIMLWLSPIFGNIYDNMGEQGYKMQLLQKELDLIKLQQDKLLDTGKAGEAVIIELG